MFLPGESHGQRSLAGYSPWVGKELDVSEHTFLNPVFLKIFANDVSLFPKQLLTFRVKVLLEIVN